MHGCTGRRLARLLTLLALAAPATADAASRRADLAVTGGSVSHSARDAANRFRVAADVRNRGTRRAPATQVAFFLTTTRSRRPGDPRAGVSRLLPVKPRRSVKVSGAVVVPVGLRRGSYAVVACADPARAVRETSERNNCRNLRGTVIAAGPLQPPQIDQPVPVPPAPAAAAPPTELERSGGDGAGSGSQPGSTPPVDTTPPPDTTPPVAPEIADADPPSGSDTAVTRLRGSAEAGSTVRLYQSDACKEPVIASATAASFAAPGITVGVVQASRSAFTARAVDPAGNVSACSGSLAFEEVARREVEPNGTKAQADQGREEYGVSFDADRFFDGRLDPAGDADLFRVDVAETSAVTLTVTGRGAECPITAQPSVRLLEADGMTQIASDDGAGGLCPRLTRVLRPGPYYVAVQSPAGSTAAIDYVLEGGFASGAAPTATDPPSPSGAQTVAVHGVATAGSTVELFTNGACGGAPAASGPATDFEGGGIAVSIPKNTTHVIRARASRSGLTGPCSSESVSYTHSPAESEPNDTTADADARAADVVLTGTTLLSASLDPASDVDVFRMQLAEEAELRLRTHDPSGTGCSPPVDTVLSLLDASGNELESNDDLDPVGGLLCSGFDRSLASGTYYVKVENFSGGSPSAYGYTLAVTDLPAARAQSTTPASPASDATPSVLGTATAASTVTLFTRSDCSGPPAGSGPAVAFSTSGIEIEIGDNRRRPIYTRAAKDGLTGSCTDSGLTYESTAGRPAATRAEAEPNDNAAGADAQGFIADEDDVVAGSLATESDVDLFRLALSSTTLISFETADDTGGDCPVADFDTRLRLLAGDGTTQVDTDDDSGIAFCDAITRELPAGTFYLEVGRSGSVTSTGQYRLLMRAPAATGDEPEIATPATDNDVPARATPLPGTSMFVNGGHQAPGDADWYAITLPGLASVRAEVVEGAGATETCESDGVDSALELYRSDGTLLADDDNGGRGRCSLLDGTGSAPRNPGALDLRGGTYLLKVTAAGEGSGPERSFDYRLAVGIR